MSNPERTEISLAEKLSSIESRYESISKRGKINVNFPWSLRVILAALVTKRKEWESVDKSGSIREIRDILFSLFGAEYSDVAIVCAQIDEEIRDFYT